MQHHALLYKNQNSLPSELSKPGLDVVRLESEVFTIDEARSLTALAFTKSFTERGQRDIVIITGSILLQAQNALLKLFEEPPKLTFFHVVLGDLGSLLPTLRSRFMVVASEDVVIDMATFDEFLSLSYKDRLARITAELGKEDSAWPKVVLAGFGKALQDRPLFREHYHVYRFVSEHFGGPGASSKMLLEFCALSLPRLN